jgi:hypothetical protein
MQGTWTRRGDDMPCIQSCQLFPCPRARLFACAQHTLHAGSSRRGWVGSSFANMHLCIAAACWRTLYVLEWRCRVELQLVMRKPAINFDLVLRLDYTPITIPAAAH